MKQFEDGLITLLNLEWLGIRIEDIKDGGLTAPTTYYFSVPESSVIEVDDEELNSRIKSSDDLKLLAKEELMGMVINSCKEAYPDCEELIADIKNDTSEYIRFCAKVRAGEVWNKEMGDNRIKELREEIQGATQYKEV